MQYRLKYRAKKAFSIHMRSKTYNGNLEPACQIKIMNIKVKKTRVLCSNLKKSNLSAAFQQCRVEILCNTRIILVINLSMNPQKQSNNSIMNSNPFSFFRQLKLSCSVKSKVKITISRSKNNNKKTAILEEGRRTTRASSQLLLYLLMPMLY